MNKPFISTSMVRLSVAAMILFMFGTAMAALIFVAVPAQNKDAFMVVVGGLGAALGTICGYFFNINRNSSQRPDR